MLTTAYPSVEKGYVKSPLGKIHYWTAGKGDALLLIHQSSSSGEEYAGLIPYLADTYQLISFDWLGHGNSDDPDHELGVVEYTEAALAVLDHLGIQKCHILGHHGGALLALNIAYLQPERILKLILCGTSGPKTKEESEKFKNNLPIKKHHTIEKDGQFIIDTWKRYINYIPDTNTKNVMAAFLNNMHSKLRPYDAHYGVLEWNRNPALESLKCPVLFTQGENDGFVSRQEKLLEIVPNSERSVVANAGAFLFFEKPEACAEMIREFLAK